MQGAVDTIVNTDIENSVTEDTVYSFNPPELINQTGYEIQFLNSDIYNTNVKISYGLKLTNIEISDIYGFTPKDNTMLCIEKDNSYNGLQGTKYALTYWTNEGKRVRFYKDYYQ